MAMLIEDMLEEIGCRLAGSASTVADALRLTRQDGVDVAVLDVNVAGENIQPVAAALADAGVPFIFSTGYGPAGLDSRWRERPVLAKPFLAEDLRGALLRAIGDRGSPAVR